MKVNPTIKNSLLSLLVLLVFQEVVFRVAYPIPELSNFDRANYLPGTEKGIKYESYRNSIWYWQSSLDTSHKFVHKLNQYGFRDQEWKVDKVPGKKRVLFIGDSFLEGIMAEQSETIVEQIRSKDKEEKLDVMNLGIMGTGMNSYLKLITDLSPIFRPDIICLVLYSNDISSKEVKLPSKPFIPQYYNLWKPRIIELISQYTLGSAVPSRFNLNQNRFLPSIKETNFPWIGKENILLNNTTQEVRNSMILGRMNPFLVNQIMREKEGLLNQANLASTLSFLSDYGNKIGTKFIISYIPARHQITNYYYPFEKMSCTKQCPNKLDLTSSIYNQHQKNLNKLCSKYQIDFIDFTDILKEKESKQEHLYWSYDGHMKGKGYQLIGENLFHKLSYTIN